MTSPAHATGRIRALLAALVACAALMVAPADAQVPAASQVAQSPREVREYWTPQRLEAAVPAALRLDSSGAPATTAPLPSANGAPREVPAARRDSAKAVKAANTGAPQRLHGKVFFTLTGGSAPGDYVCSGTAVSSPGHSLAWTAGHCVNGADVGAGFATNWIFIPGYRNGQRPFGEWPARELMTTNAWRSSANLRGDLGAAVLARDGEGRGIEDVVGARGIAFNLPRNQRFDAFGYPAQPNPVALRFDFDGEHLFVCSSFRTANDAPPGAGPDTLEINCDMTGGASGGGWVVNGGLVNSVTSYGYAFDAFHLYGPYQGTIAEQLYDAAGGRARRCAGEPVTNLGGGGADDFAGGPGADSMALRGAGDTGRGRAGRDRLCGGAGRDLLVGGAGRDVCRGGPGRDVARGCEVSRSAR